MVTSRSPLAIQRGDGSGDDPETVRRRTAMERAKERAKARGEKPGDLTNVPSFDAVRDMPRMQPAPGQNSPPPQVLSAGTAQALEAVAQANRVAEEEQSGPKAPVQVDVESIADLLGVNLKTAEKVHQILYPVEGTEKDPARKKVEERLAPLDIGEFLMNGSLTQAVQIIPRGETHKGLAVTYQTVPDAVEALVDRLLAEEAAKIRKVREGDAFIDSELSQREYVRRQNEYALAVHIAAWNGEKRQWPALLDAAGRPDEAAVATRFASVRQIASPLFHLVIQNLSWFLERVQNALDVSVLGNG